MLPFEPLLCCLGRMFWFIVMLEDTHPRPIFSALTEGRRLLLKISRYFTKLIAYFLETHPSLVQVYNFVPDVLRQLLSLAHGGNIGMRLIVWTGGFYTAT